MNHLERQMEGYQQRLDLWYRHVWDLQGLWLDPKGSVIRHEGQEAALTGREFQLLGFLLDHPHRIFNAERSAVRLGLTRISPQSPDASSSPAGATRRLKTNE
jgi:DNA-binding response OmpR family regulator